MLPFFPSAQLGLVNHYKINSILFLPLLEDLIILNWSYVSQKYDFQNTTEEIKFYFFSHRVKKKLVNMFLG